jgi:hypothetical protein
MSKDNKLQSIISRSSYSLVVYGIEKMALEVEVFGGALFEVDRELGEDRRSVEDVVLKSTEGPSSSSNALYAGLVREASSAAMLSSLSSSF